MSLRGGTAIILPDKKYWYEVERIEGGPGGERTVFRTNVQAFSAGGALLHAMRGKGWPINAWDGDFATATDPNVSSGFSDRYVARRREESELRERR